MGVASSPNRCIATNVTNNGCRAQNRTYTRLAFQRSTPVKIQMRTPRPVVWAGGYNWRQTVASAMISSQPAFVRGFATRPTTRPNSARGSSDLIQRRRPSRNASDLLRVLILFGAVNGSWWLPLNMLTPSSLECT